MTALQGSIQIWSQTAAQWTDQNPPLLEGQFGFETDTFKFKVGNGVSAWNDLPYLPIIGANNIGVGNATTGAIESRAGFKFVDGTLVLDDTSGETPYGIVFVHKLGDHGFVVHFDPTAVGADPENAIIGSTNGSVWYGRINKDGSAQFASAIIDGNLTVNGTLTNSGLTNAITAAENNAKSYADAGLATKKNLVTQTTGTALTFTTDRNYGTIASPETGNITANITGAVLGTTNIVIHNSSSAPTFDSKFKKLSGSGSYVINVINYIMCQYVDDTEIVYSINQRT